MKRLPVVFRHSHQDLNPARIRLIDNWFQRFGELLEREVNPAEEYNPMPVSCRTTFEAVTPTLMSTDSGSTGPEKGSASKW